MEDSTHLLETEVSGGVTVGVVVGLEAIDVAEDEGERGIFPSGSPPFPMEVAVETTPVGQASEWIREGEVVELAVGFFEFLEQVGFFEKEPHSPSQDSPMDGLGDVICGSSIEGAIDGGLIF